MLPGSAARSPRGGALPGGVARDRPSSTCPSRHPATCSATATSRRPTAASSTRPRRRGDREQQIERARDAFYRGFVAEAIAAYLEDAEAMDSSGRRHAALLAGDDLASWQASLEPPVDARLPRLAGLQARPLEPGTGLPAAAGAARRLRPDALDRVGAEFVHTVVECAKLAFADREAWYGDPRFVDVPLAELLSAGYAEERRGARRRGGLGELRPGSPDGRRASSPDRARGGRRRPRRGRADARRHLPPGRRRPVWQHGLGHTQRRLAARLAGRAGPRLLPGHPRADVLARGGAAELARASEAAAHDALTDDRAAGRRALAFGTPGGDQQDQWSLQSSSSRSSTSA